MRAVHLGYPRISPRHFDLVVPTPEYPVPDAPNVVRIPFALSALRKRLRRAKGDAGNAGASSPPSPALRARWADALLGIARTADRRVAFETPWNCRAQRRFRTRNRQPANPGKPADRKSESTLEAAKVPTFMAPREGTPSYRAMVEAADEIYVTADSVAMVADAVNTGKPVGIVPIAKSALGDCSNVDRRQAKAGQAPVATRLAFLLGFASGTWLWRNDRSAARKRSARFHR